jgi:sentrin-specific protease 1
MMNEKSDDITDTRMRTMSEDEADEVNEAAPDSAALLEARYALLSSEEHTGVINALRQPENGMDARPIKFDIPIINSTIIRLRPGVWLNDEIVNFYMSMLQERDKELVRRYPKRLPSFFFNSYFITELLDKGGYKYANVERWSTRFKINIFEMNKIFFPVNIANNHWTMAIINMSKKQVCYYDSFHAKGERYLNGLLNYIVDEGKTKYNMTIDKSEWSFISGDNSSPRQTNGCDCGVFSVMCADFLSDDLPLSYHQSEMNTFRAKICADILRGGLTYPY